MKIVTTEVKRIRCVEWKGRHTVASDACSKFVGCAERAWWEALLEMETVNFQCDKSSIGATTQGVDLAKVSEKVQLRLVWKWTRYFGVPQRVSRPGSLLRCENRAGNCLSCSKLK